MIVEAVCGTSGVTIGQGRGRLEFVPGAFRKACKPKRTRGVPAMLEHDGRRKVGVLLGFWEDVERRVLLCRIRLEGSLGEHLAFDLQENADEWGVSLGYEPTRYRLIGGVRYVERVDQLREVSLCRKWSDWGRSPKNPATRILRVA